MDYDSFLGGLTRFLDWIEANIINGLLGNGFQLLLKLFSSIDVASLLKFFG
jgi:hypothetical protein